MMVYCCKCRKEQEEHSSLAATGVTHEKTLAVLEKCSTKLWGHQTPTIPVPSPLRYLSYARATYFTARSFFS